MKQKFNPHEWLNKTLENSGPMNEPTEKQEKTRARGNSETTGNSDHTELVIGRIEEAMIDITANYSDWLSLGFAFANEYGEAGRGYFDRISKFYPGYSANDCNRQYDHCLKAKGHGITIKSFFHLAKQAGIDVRSKSEGERQPQNDCEVPWPENEGSETGAHDEPLILPTLPESVFAELPEFLTRVISMAETKEERDVLLLGAITALGACMPNLYGIYDGIEVYPNLYLFVTAQASAGKGRLNLCKSLVRPVHFALRKKSQQLQQEYENNIREYLVERLKDPSIEKPKKPADKMLFIPANNSATGMFQLLFDNEGKGLIFETEGDTLSNTFKSDHGNYSDGYRKAFHHESISYYRRTDHEFVEIDAPQLSTVMGGTFKQIASLIPSAENGLLSRFVFYYMDMKLVWKDVFADAIDNGINKHFNLLGYEYFKLYEAMKESDSIRFYFTKRQKKEFHAFFSQIQEKYLELQGKDYMATIRRLGLISFRIAMIFNALRIMETGDFSQRQECQDVDFYASLAMIKVLIKHSSYVFTQLQEEGKTTHKKNKKEMFLELLPEKFNRKEYLEVANTISLTAKTAIGYMKSFCDKGLILHQQHDSYINLSMDDNIPPRREPGEV